MSRWRLQTPGTEADRMASSPRTARSKALRVSDSLHSTKRLPSPASTLALLALLLTSSAAAQTAKKPYRLALAAPDTVWVFGDTLGLRTVKALRLTPAGRPSTTGTTSLASGWDSTTPPPWRRWFLGTWKRSHQADVHSDTTRVPTTMGTCYIGTDQRTPVVEIRRNVPFMVQLHAYCTWRGDTVAVMP